MLITFNKLTFIYILRRTTFAKLRIIWVWKQLFRCLMPAINLAFLIFIQSLIRQVTNGRLFSKQPEDFVLYSLMQGPTASTEQQEERKFCLIFCCGINTLVKISAVVGPRLGKNNDFTSKWKLSHSFTIENFTNWLFP